MWGPLWFLVVWIDEPGRLTNQGYHVSCSGQCMNFTGQTNMATWAELQASVSGVLQTVLEFKTDALKWWVNCKPHGPHICRYLVYVICDTQP